MTHEIAWYDFNEQVSFALKAPSLTIIYFLIRYNFSALNRQYMKIKTLKPCVSCTHATRGFRPRNTDVT